MMLFSLYLCVIIGWMAQITIFNILQKLRFICKECNYPSLPEKIDQQNKLGNLEPYMHTLQTIRMELQRYRELQDEYIKLQKSLQREQTELRRRVGVQSEMRLYVQALKQQAQESYKENAQFRDNTKIHIKQLKKINELLFIQLDSQINKHRQSNMETVQKSERKGVKQKAECNNKSINKNKTKRQKSVKDIIRTEVIQRQKLNTETKRQRKVQQYKLHSSIMSDQTENKHLQSNLKYYGEQQEHHLTGRKLKNKPKQFSKANTHLISNQTLNNFFDESKVSTRKHLKDETLLNQRKEQLIKNRENLSRHRSKQRRQNRSVYSVLSSQMADNHKSQML